jgi:hypothetical protein
MIEITVQGRQKSVVSYRDDNAFRKKMCIRFLKEICGRIEIRDVDIERLDPVPYDYIIRPLVVRELQRRSNGLNLSTLGKKFNISRRKLDWMLYKQ